MAKKFQGGQKTKQTKGHPEETTDKQLNNQQRDDKQEKETQPDTVTDTQESAEVKLAELQDKYLRLSAEFDNYRKRTLKEKMDLIKTAGEDIILKVIPVLDDLERAIGFLDNGTLKQDPAGEGMILIYNKLKDILNQQGLKEIESFHQDFDTDIHEAVARIAAPEKNLKGKILDVIEKGYLLHEKVIRFAKVVVGE